MALRHGGTHLILPLVKGLTGAPLYRPKGDEALICQPNGPTIVFTRNPRNWLVSFYRWKRGDPETLELRDAALAKFMRSIRPRKTMNPIAYAQRWAWRWRRWPGVHIVRFESLQDRAEGIETMRKMCEFLGVAADPESVYLSVYGRGTFTGKHSDWREWFGPLSLRAYGYSAGDFLDLSMGYKNE